MNSQRDLAIVLRVVPFEERHRIVTALSENHGRISGLARNAIQSRRFGGALEPFAAAEWRFNERPGAELVRIDEAIIRRGYEGLRLDFERLALASVFNELMLKAAPERQPAPELFRLHANALALLEEDAKAGASADPLSLIRLLNAYIAKLLQLLGSQPSIAACLRCEKSLLELPQDEELACSVADAGWVCGSCRRIEGSSQFHDLRQRVTVRAFIDFLASLQTPVRKLSECLAAGLAEHRSLQSFLEGVLAYHLPGFDRERLKGLKFLD
jgi:DNA repair protein RecO